MSTYPISQPYGVANPYEPWSWKYSDDSIGFPYDGSGTGHYHNGVDFACPTGTRIYARGAGVCTYSGWDDTGFGNRMTVAIDGTPYEVLYGHNSELLVAVGERVTEATLLCLTGSTGASTGPHSHASLIRQADWRYCPPAWGPDGIGAPAFDVPRTPAPTPKPAPKPSDPGRGHVVQTCAIKAAPNHTSPAVVQIAAGGGIALLGPRTATNGEWWTRIGYGHLGRFYAGWVLSANLATP